MLATSAADADPESVGAGVAAASSAAALVTPRRAVSRQLGRGGRAFTFAHNYANCSRDCGLEQGAGGCGEAGWCTCAPGHGGPGCGFSASALYGGAAFAFNGANLYTHLMGEVAGTGTTGGGTGPVSDAAKAWKGARGSGGGSQGGQKHQHQAGVVRHEQLGRLLDWLFGSRLVRPGADAETGPGDGDKAARPADVPQFVAQVGCHHHSTVEWGRWLWTRVGGGLVLCVDPWLPSWSGSGSLAIGTAGAASAPGSAPAFRAFLSLVSSLGLEDLVLPMAALPRDAAAALSRLAAAPDVVHVLGAFAGGAGGGRHGYEELTQQMRDWWAVLAPGGVMMVPSGGSVTASLAMGMGVGMGATHGGQPEGSPGAATSDVKHAPARAGSSSRGSSSSRVMKSSSGGGGNGGRMNSTELEAIEAAVDAAVAAFATEHEAVPVRVHAHWLLVKAVAGPEGAGGGAAVALGLQKRRDGSTVGAPAAGGDAGGGAGADSGGKGAHQGTASAMEQLQKQLQLVQQQVLQLKQQQQQQRHFAQTEEQGQQVAQAAQGQQGSGPTLLRDDTPRFVLDLGPGGDVRQGGRCNASLEVFPEQLRGCSFGEYLWVSEWNYAVVAFPGSTAYVEPDAWGNSLGTYYQVGRAAACRPGPLAA